MAIEKALGIKIALKNRNDDYKRTSSIFRKNKTRLGIRSKHTTTFVDVEKTPL